jgi:hypothetical protein
MQLMSDSLTEKRRQSAVAQAKTMVNESINYVGYSVFHASIFLSLIEQNSLATRSLSALKSRREEIIDNLEDLVGKDETMKISNLTTERANTLQNLQVGL